jgi:hypothetical protein
VLRLLPAQWRARYGGEVSDALAHSRRPLRDLLDVTRLAVELHGRELTMRPLWIVAAALVALGLAGAAWATPQLADGVAEIPGHWWSTLAVMPLVVGLALAAGLVWWRRRAGTVQRS